MQFKTPGILIAALAACTTLPARAVGQLVDVQIVDRTTGEVLTPIRHGDAWWVAGRPGARYRLAITNRGGQRTLNVISIDGINAISGNTAAWNQTGYVLGPYERFDVDGWRKNRDQIAAFEFASLSDSYAARTGRPSNVGVIGVAVFDERPPLIPAPSSAPFRDGQGRDDATRDRASRLAAPTDAGASPPPASSTASSTSGAGEARASTDTAAQPPRSDAIVEKSAQRERLGTGHGAIERSSIDYTSFGRKRSTPNEIVTIHYDRLENLIAMGIVAAPLSPLPPLPPPAADPFPDTHRFVPDPPPRGARD